MIVLQSVPIESKPALPNVMRVEVPMAGWVVEEKKNNKCKVSFVQEADFKLALFIQKQVLPAFTHLSEQVRVHFAEQ